MTQRGSRYRTAARFSLIEQARNHTALGLLAVFLPLWFVVMRVIVPDDPVEFHLRSNDSQLTVNGFHLTLITACLNALTLIVGFMSFAAVRRDTLFDRRLARAGFPRALLLLARLTATLVVSITVSLYALVILLAFWRPENAPVVFLGFVLASLIYGALGILLGVIVRGELEGFFVIIMVSMIDTFLQNPIGNPAADKPMIALFPTYGVMQFSTEGAFTGQLPWVYAGLALAWVGLFIVAGVGGLWLVTRAPAARKSAPASGPRRA